MQRKLLGLAARFGAGAVLAGAMAGGVLSSAAPAGAAVFPPPRCNVVVTYTVTSTSITGNIHTLCPLESPSVFPDQVVIDKYVNGTAVAVASGLGTATYNCQGSAENQFSMADDVFNAACG